MQITSSHSKKRIENIIQLKFLKGKSRLLYICYTFILCMILLLLLGVGFIANVTSHLPSINTPFERTLPESTQIFDAKGNVIYTLFGSENRLYTPYKKIPRNMKMAIIAAEDINFYREEGINPFAILRAAFHDVFFNTVDTPIQGASTLTQQLIKYTSLTSSRTIERKMKEIILALKIVRVYSKPEILETYLNTVPFGGNNYGIESAARAYFNKDIWQLDLAQCAFLAGLVQAPGVYSPVFSSDSHAMQSALIRQHYVLDQMQIHENITHIQANEIAAAKIEKLVFKHDEQIFQDPFFSLFIRDWLFRKYGKKYVLENGLKVYTTLDPELQQSAQTTITNTVSQTPIQSLNIHNASLISVDNSNGNILAMVGSVDYNNKSKHVEGKVNMTLFPITAGTSILPFVYLTSLEHGYDEDTIVNDTPTSFPENYTPSNFDDQYEGQIPLQKAVIDTRTVPAIEITQKIGLKSIYTNLLLMGFSSLLPLKNYNLSFASGEFAAPLFDETSAYAMLAREGVHHPNRGVLKVLDKYSHPLYQSSLQSIQIFPKENAVTIRELLKSNGIITSFINRGYKSYGQSGNDQVHKNNVFIGSINQLTTGIWMGNTDQSDTLVTANSDNTAGAAWNTFMLQAIPFYNRQ